MYRWWGNPHELEPEMSELDTIPEEHLAQEAWIAQSGERWWETLGREAEAEEAEDSQGDLWQMRTPLAARKGKGRAS